MTGSQLFLHHEAHGVLPDGREVTRWTFGSRDGVRAEVVDLGARLHALYAPDQAGTLADIVLSPADPAELLGEAAYFGAIVGRYANRIAGGDLVLDGIRHELETQPDGTALHGGPHGYDARIWTAVPLATDTQVGVRFALHSPDGDQGHPGALDVTVDYLLGTDGELRIDYRAVTDAPTVVNLTNHAYFNLAGAAGAGEGADGGTVHDHVLQVDADEYVPVGPGLIPVGPAASVAGTPFDLRQPRLLGEALAAAPDGQVPHEQLALGGGGFDHNWILRTAAGAGAAGDAVGDAAPGLRTAARLHHPASGRALEVRTTEPGIQVYTAGGFDGSVTGKDGTKFGPFAGIALETQHFPDSPHHPEYPSTILRPGEEYRSTTVFACSVVQAATERGSVSAGSAGSTGSLEGGAL